MGAAIGFILLDLFIVGILVWVLTNMDCEMSADEIRQKPKGG